MADDPRPPRSFRRNVDEDIKEGERQLQQRQAEMRAAERARILFGGSADSYGFLGRGRTDRSLQSSREAVENANRELNDAREYRRMYPDEQPVGSPGRPNVVYKKGGAVKPHYGSTEDIVGHGKTKAAAKNDYARKMKAVGLKPKGMAAGGSVASKRADGCAARGKTKGRMV